MQGFAGGLFLGAVAMVLIHLWDEHRRRVHMRWGFTLGTVAFFVIAGILVLLFGANATWWGFTIGAVIYWTIWLGAWGWTQKPSQLDLQIYARRGQNPPTHRANFAIGIASGIVLGLITGVVVSIVYHLP